MHIKLTAVLLCAVIGGAGCGVGAQEGSDVPSELPSRNSFFRNGCDPNASVGQCSMEKGIYPRAACAFLQRVPGGVFAIDRPGPEISEDGLWRQERYVVWLPDVSESYHFPEYGNEAQAAQVWDMPLQRACETVGHIDYNNPWVTWVPTEAGCNALGGYNDGIYCYQP